MTPSHSQQPSREEGEGAFERDSLPWAFGRMVEEALREAFSSPALRRQYAWWLQYKAARAEGADPVMQLTRDGQSQLWARRQAGEFVLTVEADEFIAVLACVAVTEEEPVLGGQPGMEGGAEGVDVEAVCMAHFEGDRLKALRWARNRAHGMRRRPANAAEDLGRKMGWHAPLPGKC